MSRTAKPTAAATKVDGFLLLLVHSSDRQGAED